MPDYYGHYLRQFYNLFSRGIRAPAVPSAPDKQELIRLESIRLTINSTNQYQIQNRIPDICGTSPQKIVVEVRQNKQSMALTYWYYWPYDHIPNDHDDWEPVSLIYIDNQLAEIQSRIHDRLFGYSVNSMAKPVIFF